MIDALLYGVRDTLWQSLGYNQKTADVMANGQPPPRCGDYFVAISEGPVRSTSVNCLNEYYAYSLTLTMKTTNVPFDRMGNALIAKQIARTVAREQGFNARAEQLRALMHQNWQTISLANNYIMTWTPDDNSVVYGFCESAKYAGGATDINLAFDMWFDAEAQDKTDILGIYATLNFVDARRLQAIGLYA